MTISLSEICSCLSETYKVSYPSPPPTFSTHDVAMGWYATKGQFIVLSVNSNHHLTFIRCLVK